MLGIYNYNKEGYKAILVDTNTNTPLKKLKKVTAGWAFASNIKRENSNYSKAKTVRIDDEWDGVAEGVSDSPSAIISVPSKYTVGERFSFMNQLIKMTIEADNNACIVCGPAGIGKTFQVMDNLQKAGKKPGIDYTVTKGHLSPLALYALMHDNRDKTLIFDDCDSIFKNDISENLLKAALDSYDRRTICWNSRLMGTGIMEGYDSEFDFTGKIIFISNMSQSQMNPALVSRAMVLDLNMSKADVMEHIENLNPVINRMVPKKTRDEVMTFLKDNVDQIKDMNLRTLMKVTKLAQSITDWQGIAHFMVTGA